MITTENIERYPVATRRTLEGLAKHWPVGDEVTHVAGWTGRVANDRPGNPLTLGVGEVAHVLLSMDPRNVAVCVTWDADGYEATAWFRPKVLSPASAPAPRRRTRSPGTRTQRRAA